MSHRIFGYISRRFAALVNVCLPIRALFLCLLGLGAVAAPARAQSSADPVYVFHTNLGDISVQLYPDVAPQTVANFLHYVNAGAYTNSLIHRSVPGFIFQGGAYQVQSGPSLTAIPTIAPVVNEFHISNTRGTIAMAKLGGDPNSATSQWFFNEADSNAANLNNQNGGFTVFGKVTDSASLAVMDAIAAVPVPSPPPYSSPLDQLPLINYQPANGLQMSNLVVVSSITPVTHSHLLWVNTNGTAAVWSVAADGSVTSTPAYGPIPGWNAHALADGTDGRTRLLWTRSDGQNAVWTVNPVDGTFTSTPGFGPIPGWNVASLSVGPDNLARLQWKRASDGMSSVWTVAADGSIASTPGFGPYGTWTAGALAVGGDGLSRLLWGDGAGRFSVWTLDALSNVASTPAFGPIPGWAANAVAGGPDLSARLLLNRSDGGMAVWTVTGAGAVTSTPLYGPIPSWSCHGLAVGPDALSRVLWSRSDGASAVWTVGANGSVVSTPLYGPIPGWSAVALSVGP